MMMMMIIIIIIIRHSETAYLRQLVIRGLFIGRPTLHSLSLIMQKYVVACPLVHDHSIL